MEMEELLRQRELINEQIKQITLKQYQKYNDKREKVVDDNPYSRLMALEKMGVVQDYNRIQAKCVVIVGVGGVGSVTGEMLTRMGVGKLILYDYDKVELANMNRLFYTPNQVGLSKVLAAKQSLEFINPGIQIHAYDMNITTQQGYDHLKQSVLLSDLILSCVDNYAARMTINIICLELNHIWLESGVSEDAMSSHIQIINPGQNACFACASPLALIDDNESSIKREGVCAASLPTTMGITAGFLAQAALKILLEFGQISYVLGYNAKLDFFQNFTLQANPECSLDLCRQLQLKNDNSFQLSRDLITQKENQLNTDQIQHTENEWGIETVQDDQQYIQNQNNDLQQEIVDQNQVQNSDMQSLMDQLKNL